METRNDKWAMEQLLAGKKVRRAVWASAPHSYLHLSGGLIVREDGICARFVCGSDWELYDSLPACRFCGNAGFLTEPRGIGFYAFDCSAGCIRSIGSTKEIAEQRWREINTVTKPPA